RVVLLLPLPAFTGGDEGISAASIAHDIVPLVRQVAYETGNEVLNLFNLFVDSPELFPDFVHPSAAGAARMAQRVYEHIQLETVADIKLLEGKPSNRFNFHGFEGLQFDFEG